MFYKYLNPILSYVYISMHESKHIYTAKLLQVNSYIERSALCLVQISKPNILGLYIYTEHDTVASLPCAFIRGSYIVNQILCKIKLMYQQYLYYCSVERSNSQPARIYYLFKTITDNQVFRIVSTLRLRIHEERINSKAKQNLHSAFTRRQ